MLKRLEIWAVLLGLLGLMLYLVSESPKDRAARVAVKERAEAKAIAGSGTVSKDAPRGPIVPPSAPVQPQPKAKPKPKPKKDLEYMKRNGLLGMDERFVEGVFDSPYWTQLASDQFEHENGSTVTIGIENKVVVRARFRFSPDLASAAMQNVLDGMLGNDTISPLNLEDLATGQTPLSGEYTDKDGQVFNFRGDRQPFKKTDKFTAWLEFEKRQ